MQHLIRVTYAARPRARATVLALCAAFALAACSSGGAGGGGGSGGVTSPPPPPPPAANRAPTAANDILQVSAGGVASLDVLANDRDPDGDALTVTITEQPFVGRASVNSNGTVRIDDLPSGFRGLTRFSYQVRDPGGLTATAGAAVFVDTKPYRLAFAADGARNGAGDLYYTDFAAAPVKIAPLIDGAKKRVTYRVARSGATAAYVRADATDVAATEELWYVRTQPLGAPVRVTLPAPLLRVGGPQFLVSPDGNWLVFTAGPSKTQQTLYVLDVRTGGSTATAITVAESPVAWRPAISPDSRYLYWIAIAAVPDTGGTRGALWRVPLDRSSAPARVSAPGTFDDGIVNYTVLESRALVIAGRERAVGTNAFVAIDPAAPGVERVLSTTSGAEDVDPSGILLAPDESKFTYVTVAPVNGADAYATYVANVSGTPAPQLLIPRTTAGGAVGLSIRPDSAALLYFRTAQQGTDAVFQYYETPLDRFAEGLVATGAVPLISVGDFVLGAYDGTNDRVVFERSRQSTIEIRNEPATVSRANFGGTPVKIGTATQVAPLLNYAALSRGAVVLGERPPDTPQPVQPALVNVAAPDKLLPLTPGLAFGIDGQTVQLMDAAP